MFKAVDPELAIDLWRILPPTGENRSVITLAGETLTVDIYYDKQGANGENCARIVFDEVASVIVSQIPGVDVTQLEHAGTRIVLGNVVEFRKSSAAIEWTKMRPWKSNRCRHFQLLLTEEGRLITVFCVECRLVEMIANAL